MQRSDAGGSTLFWQALSRNGAGQLLGETLGNGVTQSTVYDGLYRPLSSFGT